jgi:ferredoxin
VIDPDDCVDCGLCPPECPENAIYPENRLEEAQRGFIALNAELSKCWPVIEQELEPLDDHAEWAGRPDKLPFLKRNGA